MITRQLFIAILTVIHTALRTTGLAGCREVIRTMMTGTATIVGIGMTTGMPIAARMIIAAGTLTIGMMTVVRRIGIARTTIVGTAGIMIGGMTGIMIATVDIATMTAGTQIGTMIVGVVTSVGMTATIGTTTAIGMTSVIRQACSAVGMMTEMTATTGTMTGMIVEMIATTGTMIRIEMNVVAYQASSMAITGITMMTGIAAAITGTTVTTIGLQNVIAVIWPTV